MRRVKSNGHDYLLFGIVALTLLLSGTTIYSIDQFARLRNITVIALYGMISFFILINNNRNVKKDFLSLTFGTLIFLLIYMVVHQSIPMDFLPKALLFLLYCFIFLCCDVSEKAFKYLYGIIIALSYIALVFFIMLYILKLSIPYSTLHNGFYRSFFYLFFNADVYRDSFGSIVFYRMQSVFWEPGVYAIYLVFSIFYYYFIDKNKKKKNLYILVICLLLTLSTTGLILGVVIVSLMLIKNANSKKSMMISFIPIICVAIAAIYYLWLSKKNGEAGYGASYKLRTIDLQYGIEVWKKHFLFGTGYNNVNEFEQATIQWQRHNSNGFLTWCMTMGLWGCLSIVLPLIANIFVIKDNTKIAHIVFAIVFIVVNCSEPIMTTPLMLMLLAYEYKEMKYHLVSNSLNIQKPQENA